MRRVLIDPGSSAELLQMSTYRQMGLPSSTLKNPRWLLSGYNRATTTSLTDVVLPVQAGPVTLNVQFSVVEDLSIFNVIMGRAWIHGMKVIPSSYHQMVSCLIEGGQIDLLGSQLVARQCCQVVLDSRHPASDETSMEPSNAKKQ